MSRAESDESSVGSRWCEGFRLLDPLRQEIGRVDRVFCDRVGEPRYVRVRVGVLAQKLILIPVVDVLVDLDRKHLILR